MADKSKRILQIRDLEISFSTANGKVRAIRGIRFDLFQGETVAIVGESGSGKSVTVRAIMGILAKNGTIDAGSILFYDRKYDKEYEITKMSDREIRHTLAGKRIGMIFQDPMTSLDPTMTIGRQITESMRYHFKTPKKEADAKAIELLRLVGFDHPEKRMKEYPSELSGGQRQRVVIAIALAMEPDILICDEPTTALDVTVQSKILDLIKHLQKLKNLSVIYITHDLGVVAKVADYVAVMYAGRIVEKGSVEEIFYDPKHPYTWGLLMSLPDLSGGEEELFSIPGNPVNLALPFTGDPFAPRNPYALVKDFSEEPPLYDLGGKHRVASFLMDPRAPEVHPPKALEERIRKMREEANRG